jgi:hypothetical protein
LAAQRDQRLQTAATRTEEIAMIKIRKGLLGAATIAALLGSLSAASANYQPSAEQRSACMGDTLRLCASEIPNTTRIINCLQRQKAQVSPRCRAFFDKAGM